MPMTENIVHKKYRILVDAINDIYDRISMWRRTTDIELTDGSDLDTKLVNMNAIIDSNVTNLAQIEETTTSAHVYAKGNMLVLDGQLYRAIAAIAVGTELVPDFNIQAVTVGTLSNMVSASDGSFFYFDYVDGHYGFYTDSAKTHFVQIT